MHPLTVEKICELTGGITAGPVNLSAVIDGCVIDSRDVQQGDAFFALSGARQHGVTFAAAALRDGANAVIVDAAAASQCETPHVIVEDAEIALAQIAQHNRRASRALVIGVTGSVGKTTTRTMVATVLDTAYTGIQSPRNFNNHLGVPLSLLELQQGDEFAVIEVGSSAPGDTAALATMVEPEFAVLTRITPVHLSGFRSLQALQQDKAQLVAALPASGVAFLNTDDALVAETASVAGGRVVTFGTSENADVRATRIEPTQIGLRLLVNGSEYTVPVCGSHNSTSALAAIAVGLEVGLDTSEIQTGLLKFRPQPGRCCVSAVGTWTVIDDTYNSSPASVAAAMRTVEEIRDCRHRLLVLGDMLDLGDQAADLHYGIGASLAASQIDHVALVGQFAGDVAEGFLAAGGHQNRVSVFANSDLLMTMLDCLLGDSDVVLVKGSRSTKMERVVESIRQMAPARESSSSRRAA